MKNAYNCLRRREIEKYCVTNNYLWLNWKGDLPLAITWFKDTAEIITNINSGSFILPPAQSTSSSSSSGGGGSANGFIKLHHHQQQQLQQHDVNTHHHHMYLMSTSLFGHTNHNNNGHSQLGEQTTHPTHYHNLRLSIRQLDHFSSVLSIPSLEPHHSGNYTCVATNMASSYKYTASLLVNGMLNNKKYQPKKSFLDSKFFPKKKLKATFKLNMYVVISVPSFNF